MSGFLEALPVILRSEGGFVDDPDDRGGATNKGVTQAVYDRWRVKGRLGKISVRDIANEEVEAIYLVDYWVAGKCDALPWPASLCHFDATVNHGPRNAAKLLQRTVGTTPDGKIGSQTLASMDATPTHELVDGLLWERVRFYLKIVGARSSQLKFLRGWIMRVLNLRDEVGGTI